MSFGSSDEAASAAVIATAIRTIAIVAPFAVGALRVLDGAFVEDNDVSPSGGRADFDGLWGGDEDIKQPVRGQFLGS